MSLELIFIELLLGAMLLGFLGSYKKRILDRAILFATIPLAFVISLYACDFLGEIIGEFIAKEITTGEMQDAVVSLLGALAVALSSPFAQSIMFIMLLIGFRIVVGIALFVVHTVLGTKRREKKAKKAGKKKPLYNKITTGALGVLSGYLICMLAFTPFAYINELTEPMLTTAKSKEFEGTYVSEVAYEFDKISMPFSDGSFTSGLATATGMSIVHRSSINTLTDTKITLSDGTVQEFNALEFVNSISQSGVKLISIYEKSCKDGAKLGDISDVGGVLVELSRSDLLMSLAADTLAKLKPQELPEDATFIDKMTNFVTSEYTSGDAEILRGEIGAVASLLDLLASDLGEVSLLEDTLLTELLAYMGEDGSAEKVIDAISSSRVYQGGFPLFLEFGLELVCEQMNLSEDKEHDYERFLADMQAVLNDKTVRTYNESKVDAFVKHCAETATVVSDAQMHEGYGSYVQFYARMERIKQVFTTYGVSDTEYLWYSYVTSEGETYYYFGDDFAGSELAGRWIKDIPEFRTFVEGIIGVSLTPDPVSIAASKITHKINESDIYGNTISKTVISDMAAECVQSLEAIEGTENARAVLASLVSIDGYNVPKAFREDIIASLDMEAELDKEAIAENISVISQLYQDFTHESDYASFNTIMHHFGDIGAMLDSFKNMDTTKNTSERMLDVIIHDKNYGRYFRMEPIKGMIDSVRTGDMSYEELFSAVGAKYNELAGLGN